MEIKTAAAKDRTAILNSCEYGEDIAVSIYKNTLKNESEFLSYNQQMIIKAQRKRIKADYDTVKLMRDALSA